MLARYFREMATHAVMGPDEELRTAIEVENAEIDHWVQILSYIPAAEYALASLEADLPKPGGATRSSTRRRSPSSTSSSRPTRSNGTSSPACKRRSGRR